MCIQGLVREKSITEIIKDKIKENAPPKKEKLKPKCPMDLKMGETCIKRHGKFKRVYPK